MRNRILLTLLLPLSACGTIVAGTTQTITVSTNPAGAACTLDRSGQRLGIVSPTPGSIVVDKSSKPIKVNCNKNGFDSAMVEHKADFAAITAGNLLMGGAVGVLVDAASGASSIYPSEVSIALHPGKADIQPSISIPAPSTTTPPTAMIVPVSLKSTATDQDELGDEPATRCPAKGVHVDRSDGSRVTYRGADPTNPHTCILTFNGREIRLFFGLWPVDGGNSSPAFAALNTAFRNPGHEETFYSYGAVLPSNSNRYVEAWKVLGTEQIEIDGRKFKAVKINHETRSDFPQAVFWRHQIFLDVQSGIELKHTSEQIRGLFAPASNWTIADVQ